MATPSQFGAAVPHKDPAAGILMTPRVDRTFALLAIAPFMWLTYTCERAIGFDVPGFVLVVQAVVFLSTMITRKTPGRVRTSSPSTSLPAAGSVGTANIG
jgi:hypothetical protein